MIKDTSEGQTQPVVTGRITFGPVPAQHGELEQLRAENAELRKRCEEQERTIAMAKVDALREAGKKFTGEISFDFIAADGYSNAYDIQWELLHMAGEYLAALKEPKP